MATIFQRKNSDGSITWRMQIRRKGLKPFITCFASKEEAENFVELYEKKYVLNPECFEWDNLMQIRKNEFYRKSFVRLDKTPAQP